MVTSTQRAGRESAAINGSSWSAGFVTVLGTLARGSEQLALAGGQLGAVAQGGQVFDADAVAVELVEGEIDAAALGVFAHVAQDVGELEGEAGFFGELFGAGVGVAEDADADQTDDGGDVDSSSGGGRRRWRRCRSRVRRGARRRSQASGRRSIAVPWTS